MDKDSDSNRVKDLEEGWKGREVQEVYEEPIGGQR
jgi:hypothetical protein